MVINSLVDKSLESYFKTLCTVGYSSEGNTNKLLLLIALQELLEEYKDFITREDYGVINSLLTCLMGNDCLIPHQSFVEYRESLDVPYE